MKEGENKRNGLYLLSIMNRKNLAMQDGQVRG